MVEVSESTQEPLTNLVTPGMESYKAGLSLRVIQGAKQDKIKGSQHKAGTQI